MAGFRSSFKKAESKQASLKMGVFGPSGSGKTFTSLLVAEGLGKACGKRVAFVDTEHGTDFYCAAVKNRPVHPEAFDFDAIYTRSITEVLEAIRGLNVNDYGVVVIDSISHIWEACINAYRGGKTSRGGIPMHAWGQIKRPYKDLMQVLLSSPMHVLILGRQKNVWEEDDVTNELKVVGVTMRAEGETPYEPHILLRMEGEKTAAGTIIKCYVEKDRTGVLQGRTFDNPSFETLCRPLLPLLGSVQATMENEDETAARDADALAEQESAREAEGKRQFDSFIARITASATVEDHKIVGKAITPKVKSLMSAEQVSELREKYLEKEDALKAIASAAKAFDPEPTREPGDE